MYVGTEKGDLYALDLRDGLKKWNISVGSAINSTPSIFGNNIAVGTDSGSMNIYNKFTGNGVWSYNPGYIPNISGTVSSAVTSGGSLFMTSSDGNVYSLNTDEQIAPMSIYTTYLVAIIVVIVALVAIYKKIQSRKKQKK